MYGNSYLNNYSMQPNIDKIDTQIKELERMKEQMQRPAQTTPTNLTQNFQLVPPNRDIIKYASNIEEVQRDIVIGDTPFFSKDLSVVWIKNVKGEIKTYELNEIIPKDEKDIQIEMLQAQIDELKKEMKNSEQFNSNNITTKDSTNTQWDDKTTRNAIKKNESTSLQQLSTSKKGK